MLHLACSSANERTGLSAICFFLKHKISPLRLSEANQYQMTPKNLADEMGHKTLSLMIECCSSQDLAFQDLQFISVIKEEYKQWNKPKEKRKFPSINQFRYNWFLKK